MSFYQHLYTTFHKHCTFQNDTSQNFLIPPPPLPPPYLLGSMPHNEDIHDREIVKCLENKIVNRDNHFKTSNKNISIKEFQQLLQKALKILAEIKEHEIFISHNKETLSETEWKATIEEINSKRNIVTIILSKITETNLGKLQKVITKRLSKRLQQKRLRAIRKQEKEMKLKEMEEKSQQIDEYLQTIKDNLNKIKQQEEAKQRADIVLKEVSRKKHDAKRWIAKLDALVKLRRARLNTLKGRGVIVSEKEAELFNSSIENIKSLWIHKNSQYDKEEVELCSQLQQNEEESNDNNDKIKSNLLEWKKFLFGDVVLPQSNFGGDIHKFISLRFQWDKYIDNEGSALPIGWVSPQITSAD